MRARSARTASVLVATLLLGAPRAVGQPPAGGASALDVPYLPQTEALCGGAAAAMLFRYWGHRHADVQQFAPLVDRRAGGIADEDLIRAIRERGWIAERLIGSRDTVRREVEAGRPPMLLIEDRPGRYHFVVAVAATDHGATVHDPAWGPSRVLSWETLQHRWKPSGFWTLRVTPGRTPPPPTVVPRPPDSQVPPSSSSCADALDAAMDDVQAQGLAVAAARLEDVRAQCPADGRVLAELAGVRFGTREWRQAASLAEDALRLRPDDPYAADVLGSSRFMLNDVEGALRAWNRIGRPHLDSVHITGLSRTRYSFAALALGLTPNALLTTSQFTLARHRLEALPDQSMTRLSLRPDTDGYAVVDAAIVERGTVPTSVLQAGALTAQALLERDLSISAPGRTGQGEIWSGSWGWWRNRPRVAMEFAAPRIVAPRGVWRFRAGWDRQTYGQGSATALREERMQGQLALSDWLTAQLHAGISVGIDRWLRPSGRTDRTAHIGARVEHRLFTDRVAITASATRWAGMSHSPTFAAAAFDARFRSRRESQGFVLVGRAGASLASGKAPLAVWSGAGEGRGRGPLLRAHRLLRDGRIVGPMFGRRLAHVTFEAQQWVDAPAGLRLGLAGFADSAAAGARPDFATGRPFQLDVGAGLRVRVPGVGGTFRVDYARGVRDTVRTLIATWQAVD